jgi:hypothetical protein
MHTFLKEIKAICKHVFVTVNVRYLSLEKVMLYVKSFLIKVAKYSQSGTLTSIENIKSLLKCLTAKDGPTMCSGRGGWLVAPTQ